MSTIDHQDEPAFARGIAGPLGKMPKDLKAGIHQSAHEVLGAHCASHVHMGGLSHG